MHQRHGNTYLESRDGGRLDTNSASFSHSSRSKRKGFRIVAPVLSPPAALFLALLPNAVPRNLLNSAPSYDNSRTVRCGTTHRKTLGLPVFRYPSIRPLFCCYTNLAFAISVPTRNHNMSLYRPFSVISAWENLSAAGSVNCA